MSNHPKELRKQVRNVVQELLPQLLQSEVFSGLYERLQKDMITRLNQIQADITTSLSQMNERSKDVQQFIMNQVQADLARNSPKQIPVPELGELTPKGDLSAQ